MAGHTVGCLLGAADDIAERLNTMREELDVYVHLGRRLQRKQQPELSRDLQVFGIPMQESLRLLPMHEGQMHQREELDHPADGFQQLEQALEKQRGMLEREQEHLLFQSHAASLFQEQCEQSLQKNRMQRELVDQRQMALHYLRRERPGQWPPPLSCQHRPESALQQLSTPAQPDAHELPLPSVFCKQPSADEASSSEPWPSRGVSSSSSSLDASRLSSKGHADGQCKPCVFWHKGVCERSTGCSFCHEAHSAEQVRKVKLPKGTRHCLMKRRLEVQHPAHISAD
mmetsp:Transcript_68501/g.155233  ORF Transcript_68501/g.155233 Transcript_68501/m.155233 type:complete len:285 (-) Transcript_68501:134-988(-)